MEKGGNIQAFTQLLSCKIRSQAKVQTHWGKVEAVDWSGKTCTVVGVEGDLPFYDVLLGLGSFYRKPTKGGLCLLGILGEGQSDAFLIEAEAFDQAVWYSGQSALTLKTDGFTLKQGDESLKQVLNDWQDALGALCDQVSKIVVSQGVSPDVVALAQIKQSVTQGLKKRLNRF